MNASAGLPPTPIVITPASGSNAANASSWLIGAHAGYNWQQGQVVFGFETDVQSTHLHTAMSGGLTPGSVTGVPAVVLPDIAGTASWINWYGTARGRVGYAFGPLLVFGTAGLAFGEAGLASQFSTLGLSTFAQTTGTRTGWVAGAGFEYLFTPEVSFTFGYQYVDLGTMSVASSLTGGLGLITVSQTASARAQFQAVMAGLSWHFAPTGGPSMPWTGGYLGAQTGGAWGNSANANYTNSGQVILVRSDARLKRDIALVGRRNDGLGIYSYKYLWSDTTYVGVMAQEVALLYPAAVVRDDLTGYMAVNYTQLGLQPMILR